jgi:hypothetical protein
MTALNFPSTPSVGQTFTIGQLNYTWDGTTWKCNILNGSSGYSGASGYSGYSGVTGASGYSGYSGVTGASIWFSLTAPSNPVLYPLWFKTDEGSLKIYYDDGSSQQWIDASTGASVLTNSIAASLIFGG